MIKEKEMMERYPYLRRGQYYDIPTGWLLLFSQMCDEINKCDVPADFCFVQIKEKWGELRAYTYNTTKEIEHIIDIYSHISRHICINCGKPDSPVNEKGWIMPICEDCVEADQYNKGNYNLVSVPFNNKYEYKYYCNGQVCTEVVDVSDYVNRYVIAWNLRG